MLISKPEYAPKGSVFVFKSKDGRFFKSVNKTKDGLIFTSKLTNAWHAHVKQAADEMGAWFEYGQSQGIKEAFVELAVVPAFCGYCSGF